VASPPFVATDFPLTRAMSRATRRETVGIFLIDFSSPINCDQTVALDVAIEAFYVGARAMAVMKHVGPGKEFDTPLMLHTTARIAHS